MNSEQRIASLPTGIALAYQLLGDPGGPPLLLIMGLGAQYINWPDDFCAALTARGLHVMRFDNRDAGHSTRVTDAPAPDLRAAMAGDLSSASYPLSDMAEDAVGLLDALGLESAHICGASMGGQIAQTMAIEHPERMRSLISIMSTTGNPAVGQPAPEVLREVFGGAPATTREEVIAQRLRVMRAVGSPGYPVDEAEVAAITGAAYDRCYDPLAMGRQGLATIASGDRTERLRKVRMPALVIHGAADRMADPSGGRATAEAIPGAELLLIEGMGHNLPHGLRPRIAGQIADFVWRVERAAVSKVPRQAPQVRQVDL